jgi:hypothetical protein
MSCRLNIKPPNTGLDPTGNSLSKLVVLRVSHFVISREIIMKKCPFCAEDIQDAAIKCKHCGEFLVGTTPTGLAEKKIPWYFRKSFIVIAVCSVGPLALSS